VTARAPIPAFSGCGIELEYMIVDRESLAIRPIAGPLLAALAEARATDAASPALAWTRELARHVVEVKNVAPTADLPLLAVHFQREIRAANAILAPLGARLMPTAMHPWMDPATETSIWDDDVYRSYDRIYGCRAHGWSNLQSMHVNLPFADDGEFERLHAAVRLIVPLLPALAASSPLADAKHAGVLDFRVDAYRRICAVTPSVSGAVVPETIRSRAEYEAKVLAPMYAEIAPLDPAGVLRHEWLNSRGAVARFDRDAIEIRIVDAQECPAADCAIAGLTVAVIEALHHERFAPLREQQALPTPMLRDVLLATIRDAERAVIKAPRYLRALGVDGTRRTARDVWRRLAASVAPADAWWRSPIEAILARGTLARRIVRAVGERPVRDRLRAVYAELCECLDAGRMLE
jgi:gamma-glutamyl:cysteine ligase YbdK (ATP-grasp superfamily)